MRAFTEEQRFNSVWFIGIMVFTFCVIGYLSYTSYKTFPEDGTEITILILSDLFTFIVLGAVFFIKLKTKINEQGVSYGFWPFQANLKHITWQEIQKIHLREYSPITEYGGWGYRISFSKNGHGKAYNVSGTTGIQIEFKNGKKTLIGTQQKEAVAHVLKTYAHKTEHA
jgi:hypothetical protein